MGRNDFHLDQFGRMRAELEPDMKELERIRSEVAGRIQTLIDKARPMLKGKGFIVIDPVNPRFDGEEHDTFEEAQESGNNVAYRNGMAIIYAPVLVMKPLRPTANSSPSALLKQLGLPEGQPLGAIEAPNQVKK